MDRFREELSARITNLEESVNERINGLEQSVNERFSAVEDRIQAVSDRIDALDEKVSAAVRMAGRNSGHSACGGGRRPTHRPAPLTASPRGECECGNSIPDTWEIQLLLAGGKPFGGLMFSRDTVGEAAKRRSIEPCSGGRVRTRSCPL